MPIMPAPSVNSEVAADTPAYLQELRFLRRGVLEARGHFCLYPVESNLRGMDRVGALADLEGFLADAGMCLRVLTLTSEQWDLIALLEALPPFAPNEAALILGLDDTPEIVPVLGTIVRRPPALSVLNLQRERVESLLPVPTIFWCESAAYRALIEHAPDFFDHYTATFHLTQHYPETEWRGSAAESGNGAEAGATTQAVIARPRASPALLDFYERQLLKKAKSPVERARILVGLAEELWRQPTGDISQQKERGLQLAREAAAIFLEEGFLPEQAYTLNIQGILLQELPSGNRDANIKGAISCYKAALHVYAGADFPKNWAATQNNLATAYTLLPSGDRDANLHRAIECNEAALRVFTEADFPEDWAGTQNNLASAYSLLPSGNRNTNLRHAITCYEAALRVRTKANFPHDWAETNFNLGVVYRDMEQFDKALIAWHNAVIGYRTIGLDEKVEKVEAFIAVLPLLPKG